jgi:aspartate/methionine/tyrosine aminotransferase
MNLKLKSIAPYASKRISQAAKLDKEFVSLSIGEPWFGPVPAVQNILREFSNSAAQSIQHLLKHYANGKGELGLREAVAERYRRQFGIEIGAEKNVLITHGGSQAFLLALLAVTEEGDEVLVPDPTYMLYANTCILLGRVPVRPPKNEEEGFILSPDALKSAISKRTRLLVLNSPENPTGVVYTKEELKELYEICRNAGVILLQDEVYDSFVLEGEHWSCTTFDSSLAHSMQLNSMSKRYGLPGIRIGWLIADEDTITMAAKALEYVSLSVSGLSHYLAECILRDPDIENWICETKVQVRARRDLLVSTLEPLGFCFPPRGGSGGFFLFPNIRRLADRITDCEGPTPGEKFAAWAAQKVKIAVVPGSVYGSCGGDHVRLVTTGEMKDLTTAAERLRSMLV